MYSTSRSPRVNAVVLSMCVYVRACACVITYGQDIVYRIEALQIGENIINNNQLLRFCSVYVSHQQGILDTVARTCAEHPLAQPQTPIISSLPCPCLHSHLLFCSCSFQCCLYGRVYPRCADETISLEGTIPDQVDGFGAVAFYEKGIQNGPDGLALVNAGGEVQQYISYQGE